MKKLVIAVIISIASTNVLAIQDRYYGNTEAAAKMGDDVDQLMNQLQSSRRIVCDSPTAIWIANKSMLMYTSNLVRLWYTNESVKRDRNYHTFTIEIKNRTFNLNTSFSRKSNQNDRRAEYLRYNIFTAQSKPDNTCEYRILLKGNNPGIRKPEMTFLVRVRYTPTLDGGYDVRHSVNRLD